MRPDIEIAPPKPPDVRIGREGATPPAQPGIGVIQLGDCELHGGIMTENGDWLVGVRGGFWPLAALRNPPYRSILMTASGETGRSTWGVCLWLPERPLLAEGIRLDAK